MKKLSNSIALLTLNDLEYDRLDTMKRASLNGIYACQHYEKTGEWLHNGEIKNKIGDYKRFEQKQVGKLIETKQIDVKSSIFSLDYIMEDSGLTSEVYTVREDAFEQAIEDIRNSLLDREQYEEADAFLIWILKETDLIITIFAKFEIQQVDRLLAQLMKRDAKIAEKFKYSLVGKLNKWMVHLLATRDDAFEQDFWTGINFVIPMLHRKNMIFIAAEEWFPKQQSLLNLLEQKLSQKGIGYQVISEGETPLLKINNKYYYAIPYAKRMNKMNIHGIQLRQRTLGV